MLDTIDTKAEQAGGEISPAPSLVKLKGIAVCGSHPQTKMTAPFDDQGWLIYACSPDNSPFGLNPQNCSPLPRVDAFFEIHRPVFDKTRPYKYLRWLKTMPRVFMRDQWAMQLREPDGSLVFPTAELYPEKEMKARFGPFTFTSSIAFIMAKAIADIEALRGQGLTVDDEPPQLGLFGILQASKPEYEKQRQGTQNMIHNATKAGIKVRVARESFLFEPPPEDF